MKSAVNGFTAWSNVRLAGGGCQADSILKEVMEGERMKVLLQSKCKTPLQRPLTWPHPLFSLVRLYTLCVYNVLQVTAVILHYSFRDCRLSTEEAGESRWVSS